MLSRILSVVVVMSFLLLAAGCGSSNQSSTQGLSDDQKAEVSSTLTSATRPIYAAQDVPGARSIMNPIAAFLAPGSIRNEAPALGARVQMSQRLSDTSKCQVTQTGLDQFKDLQPSQTFDVQGSLAVAGTQCPAALSLNVAESNAPGPVGDIIKGSASASYWVKDPDFKALNDVDAFNFNVSVNASLAQASSTGSGNLTATIHSQKYGSISINGTATVSGNQSSAQASATVTLTYPNFTAVIGVTYSGATSGQPTKSYTLNGQPVSEDQIQQLLASAQN